MNNTSISELNKIPYNQVSNTIFNQEPDSKLSLPQEIIWEIFSHLSLEGLATLSCVSKKSHLFVKALIYKEMSFNSDDWSKHFKIENNLNQKDFLSFPFQEFIKDRRKFEKIFPGTSEKERLLPIWIPNTLNFNVLDTLVKNYFSNNDHVMDTKNTFATDHKKKKALFENSCWIFVNPNVIPASLDKGYRDQMGIVQQLSQDGLENYEISRVLVVVASTIAQLITSNPGLLDESTPSKRCKDMNQRGFQLAVKLTENGLHISVDARAFDPSKESGVTAMRKF